MNIFAVSSNTKECAEVLDDKRLVKMVLETAQLISNAMWSVDTGFYKKTHFNHPCSIWVRQNRQNYLWTLNLFYNLSTEYTNRFHKQHKCFEHAQKMLSVVSKLPDAPMTEFANCTPYKSLEVHEAYKTTLLEKWKNDKRDPKWSCKQRTDLVVTFLNQKSIV